MNSRHILITATFTAGMVAGVELLPLIPDVWLTADWSGLLFTYCGCAAGLFLLLGYLASSGKYKVMILLWSLFGLTAILFTAAGLSAATQSVSISASRSKSNLTLVIGVGLFTGLALVKLAIRKARAKNGA